MVVSYNRCNRSEVPRLTVITSTNRTINQSKADRVVTANRRSVRFGTIWPRPPRFLLASRATFDVYESCRATENKPTTAISLFDGETVARKYFYFFFFLATSPLCVSSSARAFSSTCLLLRKQADVSRQFGTPIFGTRRLNYRKLLSIDRRTRFRVGSSLRVEKNGTERRHIFFFFFWKARKCHWSR